MDWREKALTGILLVLLILSLTFGPSWSMAFPILVGVILGVRKGKQEDQEAQGEQEKQNRPDSTPARDATARAPDHVIVVPAEAQDHVIEVPAEAQDHAPDHVIEVPAEAPGHAPVDARADAPAHEVDVPADGLALSGDSLAPAVDAPADAALSVDAPVVAAGIKMRRKRKLVVKLDLLDDRDRSKAMQAVSDFRGIGSLDMDSKDNILTVSGDFDPVKVVDKLSRSWRTEIVSVGPAKEDDVYKYEDQVSKLVEAYQAYYSRPLTYNVPQEETPNCVIC